MVFSLAAETGWSEERIMSMPLSLLTQYQHCLFRRNGVRTSWGTIAVAQATLREQLEALRIRWSNQQANDG